jgi:hypothetical protein
LLKLVFPLARNTEKNDVYSQGLTPPVHLRRYCFRNHFLFLFAALYGTGNVGKVTMTLPLLFKKKKKREDII